MPDSIDITGRWVGAYFQHGHERPITADFAQIGTHLQGKMTDGRPEHEASVFELALEAGLPPGTDEQIEAQLRQQHPQAPRGPIRSVTRLPQYSRLEGEVRGSSVHFVKRYLGEQFAGWKFGDQLIGATRDGHAVQYAGTLSADGNHIEGRWHIENAEGGPRTEGGFALQREQD